MTEPNSDSPPKIEKKLFGLYRPDGSKKTKEELKQEILQAYQK